MASLTLTRPLDGAARGHTATPEVAERAALPTLDEYVAFARRHGTVLLALGCLGLLLSAFWPLLEQRTYSATASVALPPVPSYVSTLTSGRLPRDVTIDTDAHLVQTPAVLRAVATAVDESETEVPDHLRVSAVPLSRVLQLTYTTGSAEAAARAATAAADAVVEVRRTTLGALRTDQVNQLDLRLTEAQDRLEAQREQQPFAAPDESLVKEVTVLRDRAAQLQLLRQTPAEVIEEAVPPTEADPRDAEVPAVSGVMTGLLVGCLVGRLRDRRRR